MDASDERAENFLDRAAFYDGKVAALERVLQALNRAMEQFGPPPPPTAPAHVINDFRATVTATCGRVFRELGETFQAEVAKAKDERELLLRDKVIDIDGGKMQ